MLTLSSLLICLKFPQIVYSLQKASAGSQSTNNGPSQDYKYKILIEKNYIKDFKIDQIYHKDILKSRAYGAAGNNLDWALGRSKQLIKDKSDWSKIKNFENLLFTNSFSVNNDFSDFVDFFPLSQEKSTNSGLPKNIGDITDLQIIVLSARKNYYQRQAIRHSWAKNFEANVIFFVGEPCLIHPDYRLTDEKGFICSANETLMAMDVKRVQKQRSHRNIETFNDLRLRKESNLVILPVIDTYKNLTLKLKHSYRYLLENRQSKPKWILKIDDDSFVKVQMLYNHLQAFYNPETAKSSVLPSVPVLPGYVEETIESHKYYLYAGRLHINSPVLSDGKWADNSYKNKFYPPYMNGCGGHIISYDIAKYIIDNFDNHNKTHDYANEDTSLGIWLYNSDFVGKINYVNFDKTRSCDQACGGRNNYMVGHQMSTSKFNHCQNVYEKLYREGQDYRDLFLN